MKSRGINLSDEDVQRADEIAAELIRRYRVNISRAEAIRQAIQWFHDELLSAQEEVTSNGHE